MHQPFVIGLIYVFDKLPNTPNIPLFQFLAGLLSVALGIVGPLFIMKLLSSQERLINIIFPHSLSDYFLGLKLSTRPQV